MKWTIHPTSLSTQVVEDGRCPTREDLNLQRYGGGEHGCDRAAAPTLGEPHHWRAQDIPGQYHINAWYKMSNAKRHLPGAGAGG